ncbi:MAG: hypothetical protein ACI8W1_002922 [Candidatus Azotimanducaceae bacterium]|jgi:hypothetical protein
MILGCLVYPVTVCGTLDLSNERGYALAECMLTRNLAAIKELNCAELLYILCAICLRKSRICAI